MYFKTLEIQGFKSFAENTKIEFLEGLTCVVGPNGSGKSNISDAIKWVLGEQSAKSIRGSKMEDVIFSGTETRSAKGVAQVSLTIDNSSKILPIEYSEVTVMRRYFKSGESEYYINGNACRLKDIRNLFLDTGIGVDGYSIIGQGKIADIINNKDGNLKEIFDEASGIMKYKTEKNEAETKLEKTKLNLSRINDILNELEGRVNTLKEESIVAKEYQELSDKHKRLEINIILTNIEKLTKNEKVLKDELASLQLKIDEKTKRRDDLKDELAEVKTTKDDVLTSAETLKQEKHDFELQKAEYQKEKVLREEKLRNITAEKHRLKEEIELLKENKETEIEQHKLRKAKLDEITKKYDDFNEIITKEESENATSNEQTKALSEKIESAKTKIFELKSELSVKTSNIENLTVLIGNLETQLEHTAGSESLQIEEFQTNEKNLNETIQSKKGEESKVEQEKKECFTRLDELKKNLTNTNLTIENNNNKISEFNSRKNTIEDFIHDKESFSTGVKEVLKGDLKGIIGTVADIITVEQGYEAAIETALGSAMSNIVCENDDSAKAAISYLKEYRLGRATFLPIDSLNWKKKGDANLFSNEKGFDDIASNFVTFEEKLRPVFEYLLDGTVIVDNIDNAISMAKKGFNGYKYVTMSGEQVLNSGAITGGHNKTKQGDILSKKAEVAKLSEDVVRLENENTKLSTDLTNINDAIKTLEQRIVDADLEIKKIASMRATLEGELKSIRERIEDLSKGLENKGELISSIKEDKENNEKLIKTYEEQIESLKTEINSLEQQNSVDQKELDDIISSNKSQDDEYQQRQIEFAEIKKEKEFAFLDFQSIDEIIKNIDQDIKKREDSLEGVEQSLKEIEDNPIAPAPDGAKDEIDAKLETVLKERETLSEKEKQKEEELETLNKEIEKDKEDKLVLDMDANRGENRITSLRERISEEFEMSMPEALDLKDEDFVLSRAEKENREIKNRILEIGAVNLLAISEYDRTKKRFDFLSAQRNDIEESIETYEQIVEKMEKEIKATFNDNFENITKNFKDCFVALFAGGKADIVLEDASDPIDARIEIKAQPPGKRLTNMNLMSGGEKTLTAIALMFAVLQNKPAPFCILDEVDAALDDKNIDSFCRYLLGFHGIQFALITHQKNTMEFSEALYGVTMPEKGVSQIVSLKLGTKETESFSKKL